MAGKGIPISLSFESPDVEKDFPGLYASQVDVELSDDEERPTRKKDFRGKKDKRDKKDRGYRMFEEEDSEEELFISEDVRSPTKMKKHSKPSFKLAKKDKFKTKEKEKESKSDKEEKHKEKERSKKEKKEKDKREVSTERGTKEKLKFKKSKKPLLRSKGVEVTVSDDIKPVFGVPLAVAVDRSKCHDSIPLPAIFRECIDYIQEFGLSCEGIYRISGVKSKIQALKECYNRGQPVYLHDYEPNVIASLLKLYLRELPEPVLTTELTPKFEQASTIKNVKQKLESTQNIIDELPEPNRLLLSWMIVHMTNIISMESQNKMSLQNVSIVLSPTMQISHRVLNVFFTHSKILFRDTVIKKYVPPLRPVSSRWSLELPESPGALEEELRKQESLLNQLHEQLLKVKDPQKEDALWEIQRVCTQLKRKLKNARKAEEALKKSEAKEGEISVSKKKGTTGLIPRVPLLGGSQSVGVKKDPQTTEVAAKGATNVKVIRETQAAAHTHKRTSSNIKVEKAEILKEKHIGEVSIKGHKRACSNVDTLDIRLERAVEEKKVQETNLDDIQPRLVGGEKPSVSAEADPEAVSDSKPLDTQHDVGEDSKKDGLSEPFVLISSSNKGLIETVIDAEEPNNKPLQEETDGAEPDGTTKEEVVLSDDATPTAEHPDGPLNTTEGNLAGEELNQSLSSPVIDTEASGDSLSADCTETEDAEEFMDPEQYEQLSIEHMALTYEEEELLAIGDELRQKIQTEQSEIERLHQEIEEVEEMRRDWYDSSSTCSSRGSRDSEDSEDAHLDDLQDIMMQLSKENAQYERDNQDLSEKIHQEQQICLEVKVQIRIIQQQQQNQQQQQLNVNNHTEQSAV